jgi:NADH-quinone oxidoreductase subunit L
MFFGWEGVGLASYLLIGFWYEKPAANAAAMKAFIVNRVGDFGFALGIFLVFVLFGTVTPQGNFCPRFPKSATTSFPFPGRRLARAHDRLLLLFMGAMASRQQFLPGTPGCPDAMEGPTPVSA